MFTVSSWYYAAQFSAYYATLSEDVKRIFAEDYQSLLLAHNQPLTARLSQSRLKKAVLLLP